MAKLKKTAVSENVKQSDTAPAVNNYYLRVSGRFMTAKYLTIVFLVLFFAFMLIRYNDDITYANMMYLLRDFNTAEDTASSNFSKIEYDEQENMSYAMYRGELCVIGNRTLKMYNVRGEETRSYEPGYADPALAASDKYLLAYNIGTPQYSVFTSIARVNNAEAPGNITSAQINNKGEYLLICRSKDTKYVVCTYDSSFREIANYHKSKYVTSAALGEKGQVVIASFDSDGAAYECQVELYYDGSRSPDATYTETGIFPLKCGVFEDGAFYVICTDRVLFFSKNGELINSVTSAPEYTSYAFSEDRLALSFDLDSLGGSSSVILFDTEGNILYNNTVEGSVSSVCITDDGVNALSGDTVYRITADDCTAAAAENGGSVLVSYNNSAVLCYKNGAVGIDYNVNGAETEDALSPSASDASETTVNN